ncbi:EAL domain-containing protein [Oribacterium parvum]|uniref:EAL domain-containing protein n=1 Tax=Oribacterium parvum TaxID=1501329 RepID=UPI0028EC0189|nr:EAL domain-containing protein [Oribacterium parvum]
MERVHNDGRDKKGIRSYTHSKKEKRNLARLELEKHIESHIEEAIAEKQVIVYLQPNVRGLTQRVCGAEALSRWIDPKYGMIYPGDFISVLEKTLKIHLLDLYVFREICKNLGERLERKETVFPISLNFSRLDFNIGDFLDQLESIVEQYHVPKNLLHIEVTESVVMHNEGYMKYVVKKLHELGYQVWMDDFGSGYSSLNLLKEFEFDTFKIDMRFLSDMGKKSLIIIYSILYMAKEIGIHTVAEGVETEEQFRFLKHAGCERMQGYYFGRPEPMENWLSDLIEKNGVESRKEDYLFDQVGLVNIISPTPFVLDRLDDSPNIYGFETVIPIAVCSETGGKICHLNFTEPYRDNLLDLGYAGTHDFQDALNNRKVLLAEKIRDIMMLARDSMEVESMDFISSGKHCHLQVRLVTSMDECFIYLIRIDVLTNNRVFRKIKDMNDTLRTLYSVYDMVILLNLRSDTLLPVYMCELFDRIKESENLSAEINKYVYKNVHPEDKEHCRAFLNPQDMWERLKDSEEGFLLSYFRSRNKHGKFVWKRFVLVRSYDIGDEEKVVLGVHALSMDKLSILLQESKSFFSENFNEESEGELDFFK